jgi:hypothetical protein
MTTKKRTTPPRPTDIDDGPVEYTPESLTLEAVAADANDEPDDEQPFGAEFDRFRDRARRNRSSTRAAEKAAAIPDYVLGEEDGFDPEIRVSFPLSLEQQEGYYYAVRQRDTFAQARVLLGDNNYDRVVRTFDQFDDATQLFLGFVSDLNDHVNGKGAADVPGGLRRSLR